MLKFWTTLFFVASQLAAAQKFIAITVDTHQSTNPGSNAIDDNTSTFWHSEYSPVLTPLPHQAVLDLGSEASVNGFSYLPRQDGLLNGNIGRYGLEISTDKITWKVVSNDTWLDDQSPKEVGFPSATIRYIRITAFTEAGNRGPWFVALFPLISQANLLLEGASDPLFDQFNILYLGKLKPNEQVMLT